MQSTMPPGQSFAKRWAIYAALGVPEIKLDAWRLSTKGLVEKELSLSFDDLQKLRQVKLTRDFSCVTSWSIKDVIWEGVAFRELAKLTGVKPEAKWVMFRCADGYTAPVPLEDAMVEDSLIAFKMNGKPIPIQQGFPARPFIPQLYGWKSAKWLTAIEFLAGYEDGYWENFSYHERGNIWDEERFKGQGGKHVRHRGLGSIPV
ncbi:MAG: sulfite oxidase-like oxidoreductase [Candidatus Bathyarchaeia archaeon]|jgi:DMSO/TMAO reductase YedYZ molybdopterin-dependent catalytic subunit